MKKYYIIFYRYEDSKTWHHSGLDINKDSLIASLENRPYIDKKSFIIKDVDLPS